MKVWWCDVHGSQMNPPLVACEMFGGVWKPEAPCRMVEMQLVPADARMVSGAELDAVYSKAFNDGALVETQRLRSMGFLISDPTQTEPPKDPWDYDP